MPAWLLAAGSLLRTTLFGTRLRAAITAGSAGLALPDAGVFGGFGGGGGDEERVRRRRRKRALTQSDRNDIAFIAATIGKAAAGSFAVQLATRSR